MLFLDVNGFTRITESAHQKGYYGIEIVTGVLNHYFEALYTLIHPHGGDILKFGGDSCLLFFAGMDSETTLSSIILEIQVLCEKLNSEYMLEYGFGFGVHGGAVLGEFCINIIGDPSYHLDYYIYSESLAWLYNKIATNPNKELLIYKYRKHTTAARQTFMPISSATEAMFLPHDVVNQVEEASASAELRNAVVVFVHLQAAKGKEIPINVYDSIFGKIQRWVYQFGGVINKTDYTEKGYIILILFGVPVIQGDDIERAFLCAQRLPGCMTGNVTCNIGITYSNIYCGPIGATGRWEYGIIGNAVNVAARLLSFAGEGQIAMTKEILPYIESRFATRYVGSSEVRGIKEAIPIYLFESELPEHWLNYSQSFSELPCIVDTESISLLSNFTVKADAGLLTISGNTGSGRSYLLWQLCNMLQAKGSKLEIVVGEKSRHLLRLELFYSLLRRKSKLVSIRHEFGSITEIATQNGISWNDSLIYAYLFPDADAEHQVSKEAAGIALDCIAELCAWLLRDFDAFIIDNLDSFDPASRLLMQKMLPMLLVANCKVVFTCTPECKIDTPEGYNNSNISIGELKTKQAERIVEHFIPLVSKAAQKLLHKLCSGNIKFLVAMLNQIKGFEDYNKDLLTEKAILEWQSRGKLSGSLEGILLSSFQTMPPIHRQLLKLISIYDSPFTIKEISELGAYSELGKVAEMVGKLMQDGTLELLNISDKPAYVFANPLLKDCIYRSILLSEKRSLHKRIAEALEQNTEREAELLPAVIYHFSQAEDSAKLMKHCRKAAQMFFAAGAWSSSLAYYKIIASNSDNIEEINAAYLRMAEACIMLGDNAKAKELLDECQNLSAFQNEYSIYLRALYLNNTANYSQLFTYLDENLKMMKNSELKQLANNVYLESCLYGNRLDIFFKKALKLYPTLSGKPEVQHKLAGIIAQAYINKGEYRMAEKYYRHKLSLAESLQDKVSLRIACNGIGTALSRRGHKQEALGYYQMALKYAEQEGDRNGFAKVILNLGVHYRNSMDYDKALECYNKSLLLSRHIGNLMQESITLFDMGELLFYKEDYDTAREYFHQSLEIALKINDYTGISFCRDAIGDLLYKAGEYEKAEQIYWENLALQRKIKDAEGIAHTWGNLGNIAKSRQNYSEARKLYYRQLKQVLKINDIDDAGRARFNLAMINREQGYYRLALHQLKLAEEHFSQCHAVNFINLCKQQQAEIEQLLRK